MSDLTRRLDAATRTYLSNIMQLALFRLNDENYYGINVSKIRSFEDANRYRLVKNHTVQSDIIAGYIQYQENLVPVLNMEKWLRIYHPDNKYHIYLVCEYNRTTLAFPIESIYNIVNIGIEKLQKPDTCLEVVTYNAIIDIEGEPTTCMVLDVEKLLFDVFGANLDVTNDFAAVEKRVLVAEDSLVAQQILDDILSQAGVRHQIYSDGQHLLEALDALDDDELADVGLIITDLEMPRRDGYQVIRAIRETGRLAHFPVLVNSSMSNEGVSKKTMDLGVQGFIAKTDPETILSQIQEHILRT